jgi:hypothetical protein
MIAFFEWINSLTPAQAWTLFGLVCIFLTIIPYFNTIKRMLFIVFSNEPSEIVDFSWRMATDHFLVSKGNKKYYIKSDESHFIIEGGKLILNWHVRGAYRIDIIGLGKKIKGNSAFVIARKDKCAYTLIAYTLKGKLTKSITIDPSLIKTLNTFNISGGEQFKQQQFKHNNFNYSTSLYTGTHFSKNKLQKPKKIKFSLPFIFTKSIIARSIIKIKRNIPMGFNKTDNVEHLALQKRLSDQLIVKTYKFRPDKYNEAINNHNNFLNQQT